MKYIGSTIFDDPHPPFGDWKDRATYALLRGAGLTADEAGYVMWNETCYPMDSGMALEQANDYLEKKGLLITPKEKST